MAIATKTLFNARYVALRDALDTFGGTVDWDNAAKRATIHANGKTIIATMGDVNVEANGGMITISNPPLIEDGALYVPEDFFLNVVGRSIDLS